MRAVAAVWNEYVEAGRAFSVPARCYLAATALLWVGQGIQLVLFNLYLVDLGFSEIFIGHTVGLTGLGVAAAALPGGLLSERLGCRSVLVFGLALEGAGAVGRACLVEPGGLLASSGVFGVGMSLIAVAGPPFLTKHSSVNERTFLFSGLQSVALVAQVVGSMAGGALPVALVSVGGHVFELFRVLLQIVKFLGWQVTKRGVVELAMGRVFVAVFDHVGFGRPVVAVG